MSGINPLKAELDSLRADYRAALESLEQAEKCQAEAEAAAERMRPVVEIACDWYHEEYSEADIHLRRAIETYEQVMGKS